jgi:hypothetical protein
MTSRGARRAVTAHRADAERRRRVDDIVITLSNYTHHQRIQRQRAERQAEEDRRNGVVVLTELDAEQLEADRRDEALCWPARWW